MGDSWKIPRPSLTPTHHREGSSGSGSHGEHFAVNIAQTFAEGPNKDCGVPGGGQYAVNIAQVFTQGPNATTTGKDYSTVEGERPGQSIQSVQDWVNGRHWRTTSSDSSNSSIAASHSSGSLLLSVAQLEAKGIRPLDTQSVASSTHFTVVNGMPSSKQPLSGYCRIHQLPILVITMTGVIFLAILAAVIYVQMRIYDLDV